MDFKKRLYELIHLWEAGPIEDEWAFSTFRESCIKEFSSEEAFENISHAIEALLAEKDESAAIEIVEVILSLARHSNTTEAPRDLLEKCETLKANFHAFDRYANEKLKQLFQWYRL